jgi:Asp-tRNA(Asn)/Glu-tRNA(Gln) amidotransferase C subunit
MLWRIKKMIERKDVEKLAALARITIPENEMEKVRTDIDAILAYVDQIKEANDLAVGMAAGNNDGNKGADTPAGLHNYASVVKNVMREDGEPHESGKYTEALLKSAPKTADGYIEVKKILN